MSVENWSETVLLAELSDDPGFSDDLSAVIEQVQANKELDVVLHFSGVNYLNSSNIAKLLRLRKLQLSNSRQLRLCAVNTHVWGLFLVTGLDKVFTFFDDVSMGLASIQLDQE
ncbi:MAG: STAS domain-containing protein [Planctomycetes bacterium]|nr:STAS domain-containing protein [Planctomycetota bacterium]